MKELIITESEKHEQRIWKLIKYIVEVQKKIEICVSEVDATGKYGNELTQKLNDHSELIITSENVFELLNEDGQVIEGDFKISLNGKVIAKIEIRDGRYVDVYEDGFKFPDHVLGIYKIGDEWN